MSAKLEKINTTLKDLEQKKKKINIRAASLKAAIDECLASNNIDNERIRLGVLESEKAGLLAKRV